MGEAGVFSPEARFELIDGEIIEMAPIGSPHAGAVNVLTRLFIHLVRDDAVVSVQNPLVLGERSVPQPDLALLKSRVDNYSNAHPVAADALLVVEVADTSLAFDTGTKVPLYGRNGIQEVWVVDLRERAVRVYRDPSPSGYKTSFYVAGDEQLAALAMPQLIVTPRELLGV